MKILLFNKAYDAYVNTPNPCRMCIMDDSICPNIPVAICEEYGGFQPSNTKIFTL